MSGQTFADAVRTTILRRGLLNPGSSVVCGVSGGADSVALLRVLLDLAPELELRVSAAHLDHALREGSAREADFVAELTADWGVDCILERVDWSARGGLPTANVEAAAREVRYGFLHRVADAQGAVIAVGHHADDRAETFLAQLLRGAGPRGLSLPRARREDGVVRPLFDRSAAEIRRFLESHKIEWREDPTNRDGSNLRARLRTDVLPLLRRENPDLSATLGRTADLLAAVSDHLDREAETILSELVRDEAPDELTLDGSLGRPYDPVVLMSVLRAAFRRIGGDPAQIGFEALESGVDAWRRGDRFAVDLPGDLRLRGDGNQLFVEHGGRPPTRVAERDVPVPGRVSLPELGAHLTVEERPSAPPDPASVSGPKIAWLDAGQLKGRLRLRARRPGDRYRPVGLDGTVKVQDLLVDGKVPRRLRDSIPIVEDAEGIVWIPGFRVDARARITEETQRALRLELTGWEPTKSEGPPEAGQ